MELHQLRYAVEVHRRGSFTAAAQVLHVSQSGVSAQIAKLERELGVELFDRGARTTRPTAAGADVLRLMETALLQVDEIAEVADETLGLLRGSVRIGTIIGCTIPGFLAGFAEFRAAHPGISLTASESGSDKLLADLVAGDIDLAVLAHHEALPPEITGWKFVDEPVALGVPVDHPWAARASVGLAELADADVITLVPGTGIRAALQRMAADLGIALHPAVEAHSPDTVLALAARGAGVGVLASSMIGAPLVKVPLVDARNASLSVAVGPRPAPAVREFASTLRRALPPLE